MNISHLLNILLAIALVILSCKIAFTDSARSDDAKDTDGVSSATARAGSAYTAIMTRSSVRQFTDRKPDDNAVDSLLKAAMAAPTAANRQPWQFVVVTERSLLDSLATVSKGASPIGRAPLAIIACGDTSLGMPGIENGYWIQDLSAASENILLAAHSMGLGAVWCGVYPVADRVDNVRRQLSLPDSVIPLNIIAIGYPTQQPHPKDKYKAERIHHNRW